MSCRSIEPIHNTFMRFLFGFLCRRQRLFRLSERHLSKFIGPKGGRPNLYYYKDAQPARPPFCRLTSIKARFGQAKVTSGEVVFFFSWSPD
jgi:hypothetical protein